MRLSLLLIEAGAPLEGVEANLCQFAATSTAAIQALLGRGVVVRELRDSKDSTPLLEATMARELDPAVLSMLVNGCGVDLDVSDVYGLWLYVHASRCQA
jgi:hypothetical protein